MAKDLFGEPIKVKKTRLEMRLSKHDRGSFSDRLSRLKYIESISPRNYSLISSFEFAALLHEAQSTFVNGEYIATIMLTQAFIEHRLQQYAEIKGASQKEVRSLNSLLKFFRENKLLNELIIEKIDQLRLKRNPFTHMKPMDYPYSIGQRIGKELKAPTEFLESDAKEALGLMFTIFELNLY
ncbi:MAG: hypothetical protein H8D34_34320 [Chloroflexi bacterium]|nr:hypothetical protein [Chloroflexota bacterium]